MLLNVGEVLCGGSVPRGSPCTVSALRHRVGVPFRMVIDYHTFARLSTTNLRNAENSFSACQASTQPPAAPIQSARARPPVPPWHDPPFAALRRVIFCANMTRGDVYTLTAAPSTSTGAVITFQSVSLFRPPTKGPENTHKHCVFLTRPYNATSCS